MVYNYAEQIFLGITSILNVFGPILIYVPQYYLMSKNKKIGSFSTMICCGGAGGGTNEVMRCTASMVRNSLFDSLMSCECPEPLTCGGNKACRGRTVAEAVRTSGNVILFAIPETRRPA